MPYFRIVVCTKRRKLPFQGIRTLNFSELDDTPEKKVQYAWLT